MFDLPAFKMTFSQDIFLSFLASFLKKFCMILYSEAIPSSVSLALSDLNLGIDVHDSMNKTVWSILTFQ